MATGANRLDVKVSVRLPPLMYDYVKASAKGLGVSVSVWMLMAAQEKERREKNEFEDQIIGQVTKPRIAAEAALFGVALLSLADKAFESFSRLIRKDGPTTAAAPDEPKKEV